MLTAAAQRASIRHAPRLRLMPKTGNSAKLVRDADGPRLRLRGAAGAVEKPVLLAGGGRACRDAIRRDLVKSMPPDTAFEQAGALWEVLARAAGASMVILGGELDDVPAQSVMQMLAHRHPTLPVVRFDETPALATTSAPA
jgi:hypothetical protein